MNLRKLELAGFKTFARRTEMPLPGGVTGIVGPNGSGKSNLADALRWVLGEQSLQHIRSKKTEDVIFAGSGARPAMGMAEVVLTLDNTSGWIPLDFSEVTLTRRAHRSGENEYFINGSRVRLREVVDLRNRAGFGQSSYSVIGQGLVDQVLAQRPDERRLLFEEAAGVRHYQAKRDQSLEQLAAMQQNLLRAQDIVAEITPRLNVLRHQSEKARLYESLTEELRNLQVRWYAARHRLLLNQLGTAEAQLASAQRRLDAAAARVRAGDAGVASLEAERQAVERSVNDQLQRTNELRRQRQQAQSQIDLTRDKLNFMEQQGDNMERELQEILDQQSALGQERAELETQLGQLQAAQVQLERRLSEAERQAALRLAAQRELDQHLRRAREELIAANAALSQRQQEAAGIERRKRDLESQAQQHEGDIRRKLGLTAALDERLGKLRSEVQRIQGEEERFEGVVEAAHLDVATGEARARDKQQALDELSRKRHELATRLQLMSELQANLEGLGDGAKTLLKARVKGVVGPVAQHLAVEAAYERAIGAALGFKLEAVLVEDETALLEALDRLPKSGGTLLPGPWEGLQSRLSNPEYRLLSSGSGQGRSPASDQEITLSSASGRGQGEGSQRHGDETPDSGLTPALEVVHGSHPAVALLLQDVAIAADLPLALRYRSRSLRIVTLAGDIVDRDGTVTRQGGSTAEAVLKRQRVLSELTAEIETLDKTIQTARQELAQARDDLQVRREALAGAEAAAKERGHSRQLRSNEMRDLAQQKQAAQAQIEWLDSLRQQTASELQTMDARQTALRAELDQWQERVPELRRTVEARQEELDAAELTNREHTEEPGHLRVEIGVTRQRLQHVRDQIENLNRSLANAERQLVARRGRSDERLGALRQLQSELQRYEGELKQMDRKLAEEEARLPPLRNRLDTLEQELTQVRTAGASAREEQIEQDKACYRFSFEAQRKRDEIDALGASLLDDLQLTLDLLPLPVDGTPEPSKREVDALKSRIASLGAVNPDAQSEFEEVQQRHSFLTSQAADLEQAASRLRHVISELEELTERQFRETFQAISLEFERYFQLMFGGGHVQLLLTEPQAPSSGVEILAQPPGKRLQSLAALSGGERALVAVSLLFAILTVRPVPFCLLDEVDAALDEANVKRFCQGLQALAQQTQFVVITHNRETMAMADALYGVSMNHDGVSRLFSMRLVKESFAGQAAENEAVELAAG